MVPKGSAKSLLTLWRYLGMPNHNPCTSSTIGGHDLELMSTTQPPPPTAGDGLRDAKHPPASSLNLGRNRIRTRSPPANTLRCRGQETGGRELGPHTLHFEVQLLLQRHVELLRPPGPQLLRRREHPPVTSAPGLLDEPQVHELGHCGGGLGGGKSWEGRGREGGGQCLCHPVGWAQ